MNIYKITGDTNDNIKNVIIQHNHRNIGTLLKLVQYSYELCY